MPGKRQAAMLSRPTEGRARPSVARAKAGGSRLPAKIAGQVPVGTKAEGKLDINEWIPVKDQKKMDRFIQLALVAAVEAVEDSGILEVDGLFRGGSRKDPTPGRSIGETT